MGKHTIYCWAPDGKTVVPFNEGVGFCVESHQETFVKKYIKEHPGYIEDARRRGREVARRRKSNAPRT